MHDDHMIATSLRVVLTASLVALLFGCAATPSQPQCTADEIQAWRIAFAKSVRKNLHYPQSVLAQSRQGALTLEVTVDEFATYPRVVISRSSGFRDLDDAVVKAAKGTRVEAPICGARRVPITVSIPVVIDKAGSSP